MMSENPQRRVELLDFCLPLPEDIETDNDSAGL
jgi:hypothetical protein